MPPSLKEASTEQARTPPAGTEDAAEAQQPVSGNGSNGTGPATAQQNGSSSSNGQATRSSSNGTGLESNGQGGSPYSGNGSGIVNNGLALPELCILALTDAGTTLNSPKSNPGQFFVKALQLHVQRMPVHWPGASRST